MLGLKMETDPKWVTNIVSGNIEEILTDHAWCEQKAASNGITLMVKYHDRPELVKVMAELVQEEMEHFQRVHSFIIDRGYDLGPERKDDYVGKLMKFMEKGRGREVLLMERLCFGAIIEARSCERFKVLSDHVEDKELADFYRELMASEARHFMTFIKLAKSYFDPEVVDKRWEEWLKFEADLIRNYGTKEHIHG